MIRKIEDFIQGWPIEAGFTTRVFDAISDKHADQAIADGHRTLKRLAWHLVESIIEMPGHFGIVVDGHEMVNNYAICDPPATMAEVKAAYEKASASFLKGLGSWTDETLSVVDDMYGMKFTRSQSLSMIMCHQIHHRGEMFVLMRQAGLIPPDIYGPTKEGWATMGMEPPKV
ncbi:MAG: DinB family protein [Holophagaceae bacterium]|nr:DinB family protein [Holophagaceae bacterium]